MRRDGRIDQFQVVFTGSDLPTGYHVWYRTQLGAGGPYGAWTQISDLPVTSRWPFVVAAEDANGLLQVFFDVFAGNTTRLYQTTVDGPWNVETFDLASPTWTGGPVLLKLSDGRLAYAHSTAHVADHAVGMWYATETTPGGPWGNWQFLGSGPFRVGVINPSLFAQAADGTVSIKATMWSAAQCLGDIAQLTPDGAWSPWTVDPTSATAGCPLP